MKLTSFAMILLGLSLSVPSAAQKPAEEPQRRLATLAQQKMCDEQAEKEFHKSNPNASQYDSYTSHYDAEANVCYMMVTTVHTDHGGISFSDTVSDAFEGRGYASYMWINAHGKRFWEVSPAVCTVRPRGQESITCKSEDEFNSLIDKYFGIGH
jgi:hypothetical protein